MATFTTDPNHLLRLIRRYKPDAIISGGSGVEGGVVSLMARLVEMTTAGQYTVQPAEVLPSGDKIGKALPWLNHAKLHNIYVERECPNWSEALMQLLAFPKGDFVDAGDALSHLFSYVKMFVDGEEDTGMVDSSLTGERSQYAFYR